MKRTTAISLLFLLLASQFGHHILYSIQDWGIRQEQERRILNAIPESFLERIEDSPELSWEEPGKEFEHNGRMFDVVRSRLEQGRMVHYALSDEQEGELVRTFSRILHLDPNGPDVPKGGKMTGKLQFPVFTLPELTISIERPTNAPHRTPATIGGTISHPHSVLPSPPWC